jgi:predicted ATPase/DNA-binding CsgD family transcriptional regulator/Tfp pilus assembly protein PilF
LQYAHDQRLIHRDVKPENMLLGARDEVLLADFGLVVLTTQSSAVSTRATEPSLAGTTPYLAPEQLQGQPHPASDQYALGVVVYEWLCGSRPFSGPPIQIAMQQLSTPPASLCEQVPDLSPAIEEVVLRALAKEPGQRFACVQDFASALQHTASAVLPSTYAADELPASRATIGPPTPVAPQATTVLTPDAVAAQQVAHEEQETPVEAPLPTPLWKVPTVFTPLVGREQDVAEVCSLLARPEVRLLTLLGAGGIGKTRLVIEVASKLRERFADGVCFVALAPIRDPGLLLSSIAHELDLLEGGAQSLVETVRAFLRDKHVLLLLDNFEQLVSAAPLLEELLVECPRLAIVVTSREVLRLQAEHLFPVPPLALPDLAHLPEREELAGYASVALFLQRVQAIMPGFQLTPINERAIAEICVRLDGLPLALELAAARVRVLPPQALLSRLSQRFQVLTGGSRTMPERQQTLRNTLHWSYDLLDAREQRLFRRLSVFVGGWILEAVEAVCYLAPDEASSALDEVTSLLDKSLLLQVEPAGGEARLQMLMTVRDYALECLQANGEAETIQRAHAAYYLAWVQEVEPHLKGAQQLEWLALLEQEMANVFAALEAAYAYEMNAELVQGVKAFTRFLEIRGAYAQAEMHLKRAEQAARSLQDLPGLTMTLCYLGEVADKQGNYAQAESYLQEGLALARQSGDRVRISELLHSLSTVVRRRGDYDLGESYLQEGLALARQAGDRERICSTLRSLGSVESEKGNYTQADAYLQEGLGLARQIGDREQICVLLGNLGYVSMKTGNNTQGEGYTQEALALARQISYREAEVVLLGNLAELISKRGDYTQAETYFREALALARQIGDRERISMHLGNLGWVAAEQGNDALAEAYMQEGVALARQINYHWLLSALLNEQGELHVKQQRYEAAGRDFREMRDIASEGDPEYLGLACYGLARVEASQGNLSEARRQAQESLDSLEKIGHFKVSEVKQWLNTLPEPDLPLSRPSAPPKQALVYPAGLTVRQVEVLCLVAQGLTDAQVAEQLVISPRTVNFHLTSIYNKLGVSSRSAATRCAIEQHLV